MGTWAASFNFIGIVHNKFYERHHLSNKTRRIDYQSQCPNHLPTICPILRRKQGANETRARRNFPCIQAYYGGY